MHRLRLMSSQESNSAPGVAFSPGCLPACCLCPVLFATWGGLREGPEVHGDKVFLLPSEKRMTPSLLSLEAPQVVGQTGFRFKSCLCHFPAGWPSAGYSAPLCLRSFLSEQGSGGITSRGCSKDDQGDACQTAERKACPQECRWLLLGLW